ncbi:MAG: hypothetical protein ACI4PR_03305 [Acutalibacteraceae bacterium]
MKLLKKISIGILSIAFSAGSLHADKTYLSSALYPTQSSEIEKFSINIRLARKCLEMKLQPDLNRFEKLLIDSVENLKKSHTKSSVNTFSKTTKSSIKMKKNSNPAFAQFLQMKQQTEQARKDKLGRLILKKLLKIHKIFSEDTIDQHSLADLISIEHKYPSRDLIIKTSKGSDYNYSFTHKCFSIPTEDWSGMPNLRKIINSLFKDYGILTILFQDKMIHLIDIDKDLRYCLIMYNGKVERWNIAYLEYLCHNSEILNVYYMEKLEK